MRRQRGFNLTDLLIGLAISLFGLLAVSRVMITFNQQRNTSVQAIEAQSNGTMALYLIERDVQEAGYGMMQLQNCANIQWYYQGNQEMLRTAPLTIVDGGAGSDEIRVQYANNRFGVPATQVQQQQASFSAPYGVSTVVGFAPGDLIVANFNDVCTMSQVHSGVSGTEPIDTGAQLIAHAVGAGALLSPYNPNPASLPTGEVPVDSAWFSDADRNTPATNANLAVAPGATLVNLGAFVSKRYFVSTSGLAVRAFPAFSGTPLEVTDGIVYMKAQYGVDTDGDRLVDAWRDGTFAVNNTNSNRVLAIRVGVVARSPLLEKNAIDQPATLSVLPPINSLSEVTYTIPDARYRYKVYYTVLPLRNVIWSL